MKTLFKVILVLTLLLGSAESLQARSFSKRLRNGLVAVVKCAAAVVVVGGVAVGITASVDHDLFSVHTVETGAAHFDEFLHEHSGE